MSFQRKKTTHASPDSEISSVHNPTWLRYNKKSYKKKPNHNRNRSENLKKKKRVSYLKHRYSPPQKHAIRLTSSRQRLYAPQRTQAKCTFFSSHTIFSLFSVITIHEILGSISEHKLSTSGGFFLGRTKRTFDVNPPLAGVFNICFNVETNLGSDACIKNTKGIISTAESST